MGTTLVECFSMAILAAAEMTRDGGLQVRYSSSPSCGTMALDA